jgi:tetratricopeptide (TPR) repeat protein
MTSSQARSRSRRLSSVIALSALLYCGTSLGQSSPDDLARRHFESGVAYLEESDWDNALAAFKKAHELSRRPEILLNIATVYERLGQLPAAVAALREYLAAAPTGEHAETVKRRIENLERRGTDAKVEPSAAPPPAEEPSTLPPTPPPAARPAPPPTPMEPAPPGRTPLFVAFGVGAASAAGAVITGIFAQSEYDAAEKECKPSCTDSELSTGRALQLTSTVLTAAAVVGVGVGVTLFLLEPRRGDTAETALSIQLGIQAGAAGPSVAGRLQF